MKSKFLEFLRVGLALMFLAHGFAALANDNRSNGTLGKCYASLSDYMLSEYGSDFSSDDNLKIMAVDGSLLEAAKDFSGSLVWVLDTTPGVNITRTLLQSKTGNVLCVVLYAPLSASINIDLAFGGDLPNVAVSKSAASPGFQATWVTYKMQATKNVFVPARCFKVSASGVKRAVHCRDVFAD